MPDIVCYWFDIAGGGDGGNICRARPMYESFMGKLKQAYKPEKVQGIDKEWGMWVSFIDFYTLEPKHTIQVIDASGIIIIEKVSVCLCFLKEFVCMFTSVLLSDAITFI